MGFTAASNELEPNLVHYNIMSKEEKLYLGMIAKLNCVSEGLCVKQLDVLFFALFWFFLPRYLETHSINRING